MEKERFLNFIAEILEVPVDMISFDTMQDSLEQWDSLMQLRIVSELEDNYHVVIPIEKISKIEKLSDFYYFIVHQGD